MTGSANIVKSRSWWHGSKVQISRFEDQGQGLHFGTSEQARMRNFAYLHEVELSPGSVARVKDRQDWSALCKRERRKQREAALYLNRSEGMTTDRVAQLAAAGHLDTIDDISDARFRRLVPEAEDSVIVFFADVIRLVRVFDKDGVIIWDKNERKVPACNEDLPDQSGPSI